MKFYRNLTDLLNCDAQSNQYFYQLTPRMQTLLQDRDIRCFDELKQAVEDVLLDERPRVF